MRSMFLFPGKSRRHAATATWVALAAISLVGISAATAPAGPLAGPAHLWDAATDDDGDALWQDTGLQADRDWRLIGPERVAVNSRTRLTHAYAFDGVNDEAWTLSENRVGNHDTTFELWFKPDGLPSGPAAPIFEHGNAPRGVSFGLWGDQLVLAYKANPDAASLMFDLDQDDNGIDNPDFIQAVAVVDDTNNELRLYVDGGNMQSAPLAAFNDFSSNDDLGLGHNAAQGGGGQDATNLDWDAFFSGQIALLREYRWALSEAEVAQNYSSIVVPEPHSGVMLLMGVSLLAWRRREWGGRAGRASTGPLISP